MKKAKPHRRATKLKPVQPGVIPLALARAHTRADQCSLSDWVGDLHNIFVEWIKFSDQYAEIDPDARAAAGQAKRGQCECDAIAATIGSEQHREKFFSHQWWGLQQDIVKLAGETGAKWGQLTPEQQTEYNLRMNDYLKERAAAERDWKDSSGKIGYLNQQLKTGCAQYFNGLIRKTWAERKEQLRKTAEFLYDGGGKVRRIYSQRYVGARQPVLKTVIARNRLAGVAQKLTGKPYHAFSVSVDAYIGDPPALKAAATTRARVRQR